ncbi:MAG TPA: hypothetical protein PLL66_09615, partial [Bacteroidales bacterium]|nr:hypothetical protein [Bacteroidales bacterium]
VCSAVNKSFIKNLPEEKVFAKINKKDSVAVIMEQSELCEKGVKPMVDKLIKDNNIPETEGYKKVIINTDKNTVTVINVRGPEVKSLNEAKGIITADYQNFLEKEWLKELHAKYKVVIHDDVLKSISKN